MQVQKKYALDDPYRSVSCASCRRRASVLGKVAAEEYTLDDEVVRTPRLSPSTPSCAFFLDATISRFLPQLSARRVGETTRLQAHGMSSCTCARVYCVLRVRFVRACVFVCLFVCVLRANRLRGGDGDGDRGMRFVAR